MQNNQIQQIKRDAIIDKTVKHLIVRFNDNVCSTNFAVSCFRLPSLAVSPRESFVISLKRFPSDLYLLKWFSSQNFPEILFLEDSFGSNTDRIGWQNKFCLLLRLRSMHYATPRRRLPSQLSVVCFTVKLTQFDGVWRRWTILREHPSQFVIRSNDMDQKTWSPLKRFQILNQDLFDAETALQPKFGRLWVLRCRASLLSDSNG